MTIDEVSLHEGVYTYMNNVEDQITIRKILDTEINSVEVYNYLGQQIRVWKNGLESREINLPIKAATGAYIVRVYTDLGIVNKQVIIE
jgi:hypothetical protein